MRANAERFAAAPPAAGYLYQARLALALSIPYINSSLDIEVAIERLDDISFEANGTPIELLQTKHHINRVAKLSNLSSDLWKTLRIWAEAAAVDPSLPSRSRLLLVTTGVAPDGSAASLLRPDDAYVAPLRRDPKMAQEVLTNVAVSSKSKELQPAFAAFLDLVPQMRSSVLSAVQVLDGQPLLPDLTSVLEDRLRLVGPRGKAGTVREMLEGWWWPRVCGALMKSPAEAISVAELGAKLDDIRDLLKRDALITEFEDAEPTEAAVNEFEGFSFVKQLKVIGLGGNRVRYAKKDYYRAFSQRSRWAREYVVLDDEIAKFERRLVEEWEPRFAAMCDASAVSDPNEHNVRQAGQDLYTWVETDARFPLRSNSARFLNVGSYHMLSNDLRVGWHRDYRKLCAGED